MDSTKPPTTHPFRPHIPPDNSMATVDEGYSDGADTRSQPDSDMAYTAEPLLSKEDAEFQAILNAATGMSEDRRKQLMLLLVAGLENKHKLELKKHIEHLTNFDPTHYLPAELILNVFSYLSPKDLLSASSVNRGWRARSHDQKLWRGCFAREGWVADKARIEEIERDLEVQNGRMREGLGKRRSQGNDGLAAPSLQRRESRKRTRVEAFSDGETSGSGMERMGGAGDDANAVDDSSSGEEMEGVEGLTIGALAGMHAQDEYDSSGTIRAMRNMVPGTTIPAATAFEAYQRRYSFDNAAYPLLNPPSAAADFQLRPSMTLPNTNKLSWEWIYKQRRRLEDNWDKGEFKTFTLPHPNHPEEGHLECVYTIQHTAAHLVSGSRDRTIRIWDLDTGRLKMAPLEGHEASVLCLQFDEKEDQDIIVSGGSDSMVIVWKFSTGEIVKMLRQAHDEPVLNLRFNDRYIVTCSKDKKIKVWSRHALERSEENTDIPNHVLHLFMDPAQALGGTGPTIEPFTLLATLNSHHAAVNAVMIHNGTIVSASGDRTIKAWDLHTGLVTKNYVGHTKGIACVQFDGRRVVSGSSDNTVRVFDADRAVEVACLQGHSHLVRTVQARYGDLDTTPTEELAQQAKAADRELMRALNEGLAPASVARNAVRNAGSSRPEEMLTLGAKVPPGGGGSRWARIVSGSYDESVIVWKRDRKTGKWKMGTQLHQGQVVRGGRTRRQPAIPPPVAPVQTAATQAAAAGQQQGNAAAPTTNLAFAQQGLATAQHAHALLQQGTAPNPAAALSMGAQLAQIGTTIQNMTQHTTHTAHIAQAGQTLATNTAAASAAAQHAPANPPAPAPAQPVAGQVGQANVPIHPPAPARSDSMRVFKLQFDARRVVCCSQNKVIVGWDFAASDPALELVGGLCLEVS